MEEVVLNAEKDYFLCPMLIFSSWLFIVNPGDVEFLKHKLCYEAACEGADDMQAGMSETA